MNIDFKWVKNTLPSDSKFIRTKVFLEEQKVAEYEEFDGSDKYAENLVIYVDSLPVATGRIIIGDRGEGRIGRVAVLKEYRKLGLGKVLMEELLRRLKEKGFDTAYVNAQTRVRGFYESLGFMAFGDIFMEANIPHIAMKKEL
ncbi:MAG: GNAT family N-acetyltransferase [Lachnospirales bacterium]